jgi:natural product biosynthesis luciferase-like monooxygenase protein
VREVAVVGKDQGDQLVAYVVLAEGNGNSQNAKEIQFSLFYFADANSRSGEDKYRIYIDGAKFADAHGFTAIWTPERHFHANGGLYPNPSVLSAALALVTENVQLRAGSVVLPLHHAMRVAEEWSVVDNLSKGRVGLSFTSGWIPNDFAFFPERFPAKREEMFSGLEQLTRLWRGQTITARDGAGNMVELEIFPKPIQNELPIWLTCSGDSWMFEKAGELGANVLTALLTQSIEETSAKISLYRESLARHGHDPRSGRVTLMMHTFIGDNLDRVLEKVRAPFCNYLKSHVGLVQTMAKSLNIQVDLDKETWLDYIVSFGFERYYRTASLIGTPNTCLPMVERVKAMGVDEIACLIDFGVDAGSVMESLRHLNTLKQLGQEAITTALSNFVEERLPDQLLPTAYVLVDRLPVEAAGRRDSFRHTTRPQPSK